ncbi:hypothetical protein D9M69_541340 [compost metagenome]
MTWRSNSARGRLAASTRSQAASFSRASVSLPDSSAWRMSVKWWLNCRNPTITYSTTTSQAKASTVLNVQSPQYTRPASSAGTPAASNQASQPWALCPASRLRRTSRAQARRPECTGLS